MISIRWKDVTDGMLIDQVGWGGAALLVDIFEFFLLEINSDLVGIIYFCPCEALRPVLLHSPWSNSFRQRKGRHDSSATLLATWFENLWFVFLVSNVAGDEIS
jgi:hypothetical protein